MFSTDSFYGICHAGNIVYSSQLAFLILQATPVPPLVLKARARTATCNKRKKQLSAAAAASTAAVAGTLVVRSSQNVAQSGLRRRR
jgi:hypothetical protein